MRLKWLRVVSTYVLDDTWGRDVDRVSREGIVVMRACEKRLASLAT